MAKQTTSLLGNLVTDIDRLTTIIKTLSRHGFAQYLGGVADTLGLKVESLEATEEDPAGIARRFRLMLEELGPTFIKLGQVLSTRMDLLPPHIIRELSKLQDNAPTISYEKVLVAIESGLGKPVDELYAWLDEQPLATASIAQVHRARLHSGEDVVIKVQRPGIEGVIRADLDILHVLARLLQATVQEVELYSPREIVEIFDRALSLELNFLAEATHLKTFRKNFEGVENIIVPKLYEEFSSPTVMTQERIEGYSLALVEPDSDVAPKVMDTLLEAIYLMIFEHGYYHGDPHPGNILVTPDDKLAFLDFGLVGRLSKSQVDDIVVLCLSVLNGDLDSIARIVMRMGTPTQRIPMAQFKRTISEIRARYIEQSLEDIDSAALLQDMLNAGTQFRIKVAHEYAILGKATGTLEGIIRKLEPELDILKTAQPYAARLIKDRYNPQKLVENLTASTLAMSGFLQEIPGQMSQILMDLEGGSLRLEMGNQGLDDLGRDLNRASTRLSLALTSAALFVSSAVLFGNDPLVYKKVPILAVLSLLAASSLFWIGLGSHFWSWRLGKLRLAPLFRLIGKVRRFATRGRSAPKPETPEANKQLDAADVVAAADKQAAA